MLTAARIHRLFNYNPDTGLFVRTMNKSNGHRVGDVVGSADDKGYLTMMVDGRSHKVHRIAWLYMTGEHPTDQIDHINGIKSDNRWVNLREATPLQNCINRNTPKHNTSGITGVTFDKSTNKWRAQIMLQGKTFWLGSFDTIKEAAASRKGAANLLFGEWQRRASEVLALVGGGK